MLGLEDSPKRARAPEGLCGVDLTRPLNKRLGMAGPAVTARDKARKIIADVFYTAALPADAVSHHHRGKHGARIKQRRDNRTHVNKHQSREGHGRGVSELLPISRWHLGKNRAGRRETERGKYSVWEKRRV